MKIAFILLFLALIVSSASVIAEPAAIRKTVQQYALTSANDFPSRDPKDWRLLASNDGGKNWVTLDVRTGELFSERHQRRVFKIASPSPFELYRLQIDRVRNPQEADAIQLAEIEPLGATEKDFDTLPIFTDRISAKGENPPLETALQAFDGRRETKWAQLSDEKFETLGSWIQWEYVDQTRMVVTNTAQLSLLRGRAREGFSVQIAGVVIGQDRTTGRMFILDRAGWAEVFMTNSTTAFYPGQRVVLTGTSRWTGQRAAVEEARISIVEGMEKAEPQSMQLGRLTMPNQDFQWVEVEGMLKFPVQMESETKFELQGNSAILQVFVVAGNWLQRLPAVGSRVRVRGICGLAQDDKGELVAGTLWVAGLNDITILDALGTSPGPSASAASNRLGEAATPLTDIGQIRRLSSDELSQHLEVQVHGVITELFGDYLQQGSEGIELMWAPTAGGQLRSFGSYVEIRGKTTRGDAGGAAINVNEVHVLGEGKLPDPAWPTWSQLVGGQMNGNWIEMEAVVQSTDGSHLLLYHEGRQIMATIRSGLAAQVRALVNASVRLRGVCVNATDDRNTVQGIQLIVPSLDFVTVTAKAANPADIPVWPISRLYNMGSPNAFNCRVKVKGVLTGLEGRKIFVQDADNSIMAVGKSEVVLTPRARNPRWVFWQTLEGESDSPPAENLRPGDEVEVTGYVESYGYAPMITEAVVHRAGSAPIPILPIATSDRELATGRYDSSLVSIDGTVLGREKLGPHTVMQIESGQHIFQASLHAGSKGAPDIALGSTVRLVGVCQMNPIAHAELGRAPGSFSLLLRTPADIRILSAPPWWTARRALGFAGVLVLILVAALIWVHLLHRQVDERTRRLKEEVADHEKTERLLAAESQRLHEEIRERQRTEASLAKETELLQAEIKERAAIQNALEAQIQERIRMQAEVDKIHRQLLTTSRLAGMAEVATNVLHNVGNVLNSVNVLASSLSSHLQKSKLPSVARLADLFAQHQGDLSGFLMDDEHGRNIPGYVKRLGSHLLEEQSRMLEKAQALTESVQHIKEIVAMQQTYAKVAGVCEKVSISEVVEDALKMCGEAMVRHKIDVVQEFGPVAPVVLDRHKVLQVLFNLLDNAKHACELRGDTNGVIRIRIQCVADRIRLEIIDNGIGIPKENLDRIFTQGFSTRKRGHGFGLHSSILAAQDMGGSLRVHSEGPGCGAVFTLELPNSMERHTSPELPKASEEINKTNYAI